MSEISLLPPPPPETLEKSYLAGMIKNQKGTVPFRDETGEISDAGKALARHLFLASYQQHDGNWFLIDKELRAAEHEFSNDSETNLLLRKVRSNLDYAVTVSAAGMILQEETTTREPYPYHDVYQLQPEGIYALAQEHYVKYSRDVREPEIIKEVSDKELYLIRLKQAEDAVWAREIGKLDEDIKQLIPSVIVPASDDMPERLIKKRNDSTLKKWKQAMQKIAPRHLKRKVYMTTAFAVLLYGATLGFDTRVVSAPIIEPEKKSEQQTAKLLEKASLGKSVSAVAKASLGETARTVIKTTKIVSPEIILAKDYVPPLVAFARDKKIKTVPGKEVQGNPEAVFGLEELFAAAEKDGVNLFIGSGYRSYSYQENLYKAAVSKYGAKQTYVAVPGQSQHQTGKAFDFTTKSINYRIDTDSGFEKTKEGKWLKANAWRFGFVLSYENEPWHFMYVGEQIAEGKIVDQLVSGSPTVYNSGVWEEVIRNRLKGSKNLPPLNPELNGNKEVMELIKDHRIIAVNPANFNSEYAQLVRIIVKSAEKQNLTSEVLKKTLDSNPKLRELANKLIGQIIYLKLPDGSFQKMVIMDTLGAGDSLSIPFGFVADFDQRFLEDVYRIVWDGKQYIDKDTGKPIKDLPAVSLYG